MNTTYAVVDLFAGPGGLAEGFANVRFGEHTPFSIVLSVEKDASAHQTLLLRSFLRQFKKIPAEYYEFLNGRGEEPNWSKLHPLQWQQASKEALHLELGNEKHATTIDKRLDEIRQEYGDRIVVIGGPPCQAYSIVGRARNKGIKGYVPSDDDRHFLYQEYIRILKRLRPAAFVMENVKGLLSSSVDGERIFDKVIDDLQKAGTSRTAYKLFPLGGRGQKRDSTNADPAHSADYVIRAEDYGIPQARHRVILVGIRKDRADQLDEETIAAALPKRSKRQIPVRAVLLGMPRIRSGLSEIKDDTKAWKREVKKAISLVAGLDQKVSGKELDRLSAHIKRCVKLARGSRIPKSRSKAVPTGIGRTCPSKLREWLTDPRLSQLPNSETRSHMTSDLARYFFTSVFGASIGESPKALDFPSGLAPKHENWSSGNFSDRFRVQLWNRPSTTVTSHISKDGHYFIHPDPLQCRSLTVREAARLQTFPDNYFFKGNRTQQYVQVGNAVPPYLALIIGRSVLGLLGYVVESKRKNLPARKT